MKSNSGSDSKRGEGESREYIEYSASRTSLAKGMNAKGRSRNKAWFAKHERGRQGCMQHLSNQVYYLVKF